MSIVSTRTEAIAEMNTHEAPFEMSFRLHYDRVTRIIRRVVADPAPVIELAQLRIEVKAGATVNADDFKGLHKLARACGDDFKLGDVLYDGEKAVPFADHFFAAPISCLWG